ncbi:hypothetical protein [Actinomadura sp. NTSP31]|uniref:hypothetical protein n=1 Tax=Actinomadura sp. NTSP31 TaxID=1735447 RepID=UPI0035BEE9EC
MSGIDELDGVRRLLAEPPEPSPEASEKAFGMLADEMSGGRRARTPGAGRRLRSRWPLGLGAGLVAVGAAAAVAVVATGQGAPEPRKAPSGVDLNKQAVLAAAAKAALAPTGKYWYTDQIQGQSYIVRPKTGAYAIVGAHSETFEWSGVRSGLGTAFFGRDIPSRPLTPADERLWRKAGAPSKFRVWSNDHYYTYDRHSSSWEVDDPDPRGGGTFLDGMTVEELQNLPTDPARLAAMFFKPQPSRDELAKKNIEALLAKENAKPVPKDRGGRAERASRIKELEKALGRVGKRLERTPSEGAREKVLQAEDLMMGAPLPPAVRAGLMRALAAQPGVRAIGSVTDPLGRTGVGLAVDEGTTSVTGEFGEPAAERGSYASREEIMFDPRTGELLGGRDVLTRPGGAYRSQRPGFVINYWLVRSSGWTDAKPKPPAKLPF